MAAMTIQQILRGHVVDAITGKERIFPAAILIRERSWKYFIQDSMPGKITLPSVARGSSD
jgi:hypothetical protein